MRGVKRLACLLLAVLLLATPASPAAAADSVVFTAVNDTLLPLSDDTMPFTSDGVLYVSSAAFDGTDLGLFYSRSRDKNTAVIYKQRNVIIFDLTAGTIETNNGQTFSGSAVIRGNVVFLPVDVMCRCFSLDYTITRVSNGYLLRIKNEAVVLSDSKFIDAATSAMASRYARYARAQEEEPAVQPTQPTEPAVPTKPAATETPKPEPEERTVFCVVECTDPVKSEPLLARFGNAQATWLFAPDALSGADGLLRRLASGSGATALRIDANGGAASAIAQIEAGNRALWEAANLKTRLVWLDGASEETVRLVTEAGYCPIRAALDLGISKLSASRMSARILAAADARKGRCCVFLGTDADVSGNLSALLTSLRAGNCTPASLNEVTASHL